MRPSRLPALGGLTAIRLLGLLVLALLLAGCAKEEAASDDLAGTPLRLDAAAPVVVPAGKPVIVGVSVPLTGPDAAVGEEDLTAVLVALERWKAKNAPLIAGHEIEVRGEDDGCTEAEITARAAERLLRKEGLVGVIGPDCSAGAIAAIPIYARAGIVAISGSATRTDLTTGQPEGRFFFRTAYRNDLQGALIGLFANLELRGQRAYMVDDGEAYGLDLGDAAETAMRESGVDVARESIKRGTVDFTESVSRILAHDPAFVGFAGFNPEAALLYRQLRDAGYAGAFGGGDAVASVPDFVGPVGAEQAEGVLFSGCSPALPEDFVSRFGEVHAGAPSASTFVAHYADATTVLLNAVAKVARDSEDGSLAIDPAVLRDAVRAMVLEDGISGPIAFDANGDRLPAPGDDLGQIIDEIIRTQGLDKFVGLGLVPCQIQDGTLVNLIGPGAGTVR